MKNSSKKIVGYTQGVYDMFHIGHLNYFENVKQKCDYLIVGINSDQATYNYKNKYPVIPEDERVRIVEAIKYVDEVVLVDDVVRVDDSGKIQAYEKYHFDMLFMGGDHKDDPRWQAVDDYLRQRGLKVSYMTPTKHISSTKLRKVIHEISKE
jgi:cytidyltransferase-like protein